VIFVISDRRTVKTIGGILPWAVVLAAIGRAIWWPRGADGGRRDGRPAGARLQSPMRVI